ncbi:MAG TPA: NADH-quinone oxidoreductase subunit J [Actinomycetota bacterium]|nr:NADH-quinone oxidoreductase subunit J [Actinomycetota bacterium]
MADWYVFWVLAPLSVLSGVAMVVARNAVHSALLLIVNFFTLAVFFLILGSPFLFVVQIIVYAGAIMVLFLFVIMLLGVDRTESLVERLRAQLWLAVVLGAGLVAEVVTAVWLGVGVARERLPDFGAVNEGGNVRALAKVLFGPYFFPFEVTSVLLIIAAVGAMLHGRRRIAEEETIDRPEDYVSTEPQYSGEGSR